MKTETEIIAIVRRIVTGEFPDKDISSLEPKSSGLMHHNFLVKFTDGSRVFYRGYRDDGLAADKKDIYFGDHISIEREVAIMRLLREKTNIPVPEILAFKQDEDGKHLLVTNLRGVHFRDYLDSNGHDPDVFLDSLRRIGATLGTAGKASLEGFSSIQPAEAHITADASFADRWKNILGRHENPKVRSMFSDDEWLELQESITRMIAGIRKLQLRSQPVIYDLHARNFNVFTHGANTGALSGAFDVEFAQAAPACLELACFAVQIFPLYGMKYFERAQAEFLSGWRESSGRSMETDCILYDACVLNHALSAVGFYSGLNDGIRDGWSVLFKDWAMGISRGNYDPAFVVELTRSLHKVPKL